MARLLPDTAHSMTSAPDGQEVWTPKATSILPDSGCHGYPCRENLSWLPETSVRLAVGHFRNSLSLD